MQQCLEFFSAISTALQVCLHQRERLRSTLPSEFDFDKSIELVEAFVTSDLFRLGREDRAKDGFCDGAGEFHRRIRLFSSWMRRMPPFLPRIGNKIFKREPALFEAPL